MNYEEWLFGKLRSIICEERMPGSVNQVWKGKQPGPDETCILSIFVPHQCLQALENLLVAQGKRSLKDNVQTYEAMPFAITIPPSHGAHCCQNRPFLHLSSNDFRRLGAHGTWHQLRDQKMLVPFTPPCSWRSVWPWYFAISYFECLINCFQPAQCSRFLLFMEWRGQIKKER